MSKLDTLSITNKLRKSFIKDLLDINPSMKINKISVTTSLHRNTVSKYVGEILKTKEEERSIHRKMIVAHLEEQGKVIKAELMGLWTDAYRCLVDKNPAQLVQISKAKWELEKEITHLKFLLTNKL